jgi:hypothetical protein
VFERDVMGEMVRGYGEEREEDEEEVSLEDLLFTFSCHGDAQRPRWAGRLRQGWGDDPRSDQRNSRASDLKRIIEAIVGC